MNQKLLLLGASLLIVLSMKANNVYLTTSGATVSFICPWDRDIELKLVDEDGNTCYDFCSQMSYYYYCNVTLQPNRHCIGSASISDGTKYRIEYNLNHYFSYHSMGHNNVSCMRFWFRCGRGNQEYFNIATIYPHLTVVQGDGYYLAGYDGLQGASAWFDTSSFSDYSMYYDIEMEI